VHAIDIDEPALAGVVADTAGGRVIPHTLDVVDAQAYGRLVAEVQQAEDRIDYLFNNAGVTWLGETHKMPFDRWRWLLDVNVMGVVHGIAHIYPWMVRQGGGHIVNTASLAGATGYATAAAYTMSKGTLLGLSLSLRAEAREHGVKVTVVCPGYVETNIFRPERVVGSSLERVLGDLPVGMIPPQQAARCLLDGVAKGKERVVFPFNARLLWWVCAWAPVLTWPLQRRLMRVFEGGQDA
jgi:NADP-dependent 3-hydroxy acid dehydrogenase YdfG